MVRPRTGRDVPPVMRRLGERVSGEDLKALIEARLAKHPRVRSMRGLARAASVQPNTLYSWFREKTTPRTYELERVAQALEVPLKELWAAYAGDLTPQSAEEERVVALVEDAYRRGYRDGWRDRGDDEGSPAPPQ